MNLFNDDPGIKCNLCETNEATKWKNGMQLCEDCYMFQSDKSEEGMRGSYDD